MKGKGIEEICEINATGATVPVRRFGGGLVGGRGGRGGARGGADGQVADPNAVQRDILIPEIYYANVITHDAWGDVLGISPGGTTYPIVLSCDYSNGKLYVLTIPNDYADLYALPQSVLGAIRSLVGSAEPVRMDSAPAQVALFRYDNNAFIVQNYLATNAEVTVSVAGNVAQIHDILADKDIAPAAAGGRGFGGGGRGGFGGRGRGAQTPRTSFTFTVLPHSYMGFEVK